MMVVAPVSKTVSAGSGELVRGLTTACKGLSSSSSGLEMYSIRSTLLEAEDGSGDKICCWSKLQPLSELVSDKGRSRLPSPWISSLAPVKMESRRASVSRPLMRLQSCKVAMLSQQTVGQHIATIWWYSTRKLTSLPSLNSPLS